jgi:hypothetical protein
MIWLRPWAWLGAATILLPILIHLLGRGQSRTHRFPSLRFIDPSRLLPAQRNRLQDLLLLLVRVAVLLLGVIALAQPRMRGSEGLSAAGGGVTRAIVIDTSVSMGRIASGGLTGHLAAADSADRLTREATTSRRFLTATPDVAIAGAASWLAQQSGPRELVVISDFQLGALDSNDIAVLPTSLGVRLIPVAVTSAATTEFIATQDGALTTATIVTDSVSSTVSWRESATSTPPAPLRWLVGPGETALVSASLRAAQGIGMPPASMSDDSVDLIFPAAPERATLRARATPLRAAWMIALVARLRETPLLYQLAPASGGNGDSLTTAVWSARGNATVSAAADGARLLLFVNPPVASPFAAALAATVMRLTAQATPMDESEPVALTAAQLATWERAPAAGTTTEPAPAESATGRWLWAAALGMLLLEAWLRRRPALPVEAPDGLG